MYVHVYILCNIYSAYICVYNAVFGGYHPVHFRMVENTVENPPTGISNPIYLVLNRLKLQILDEIFDRPVSSMYCKYAEYACKLQTNLPMSNKNMS